MVLQVHRRTVFCTVVILACLTAINEAATDCALFQWDCTNGSHDSTGVIVIVVIILVLKLIFFLLVWYIRSRRRRMQMENMQRAPMSGPEQLQTVTSSVPYGYPSGSTQGVHPMQDIRKPSYVPVATPDKTKLVEE